MDRFGISFAGLITLKTGFTAEHAEAAEKKHISISASFAVSAVSKD
jgi:hypothetical protein